MTKIYLPPHHVKEESFYKYPNGPKTSKNVKPELLWGYAALLNCDYQQFKTRK
jgi:hypothetical protein